MSSTNKTPNYNLPQFVGTDKPTWLGDVNQAMSIIDGQMKTNANNITSATGEVSELESRVQTAESSVSTLSTAVTTVQNQANATDGSLNSLSATVNSLISKLSLGQATSVTGSDIFTGLSSGVSASGTLYLSQSPDSSVFKVYGYLAIARNASSSTTFNLRAVPGLDGYYGVPTGLSLTTPSQTAYRVYGGGFQYIRDLTSNASNAVIRNCYGNHFAVSTTGEIYLMASTNQSITFSGYNEIRTWLPACLYFNGDLGDTLGE